MEDNIESFKVVLIGEASVGKTSMITQFLLQQFSEDVESTNGATFSSKLIECSNGRTLQLEIWDTAGQERYKSLVKMFYKDASVAVFVYDITKKNTFEQIKEYWFKEIRNNTPKKTILFLAANKNDLYDDDQVPEEEGRMFAVEIGATFFSTSAKNRSGIDEMFKSIGDKLCELYPQEEIYQKRRATIKVCSNDHNGKIIKCCKGK